MRFWMALFGGLAGGGLVLALERAARRPRPEGAPVTVPAAHRVMPPMVEASAVPVRPRPTLGATVGQSRPAATEGRTSMRRKLFGTRKRAVLSLGAVVALVFTTVGLAAWLLTVNAGSGRGQVGTIQNPVITNVTPAANEACMPVAGTTCSLSVSINNPNTVPLTVTAINFNGGAVRIEKPLGTDYSSSCSSSNISGPVNKTGLSIALPAGATTSVVVPNVWGLAANAPVACMGAIVYFGAAGGASGTDWSVST